MNPTHEQAAKAQVEVFLAADALFSAYDVTQTLRNEQGLDDAKHYEVKEVVHGMFDNGEMRSHTIRESRSVGSGRSAFVYIPSWRLSDVYDPDSLGGCSDPSQGSQTTPQPQTMAPPPQTPSPQSVPKGRTGLDARGRLCIPNGLTRRLGWKKGDAVVATLDHGVIEIHAGSKQMVQGALQMTVIGTYFVDKSDNVRLSKAVRTIIGDRPHYSIEANATTKVIVISV